MEPNIPSLTLPRLKDVLSYEPKTGPTTSNDDDMMGMAIDPLDSPEARYWIEAEIDLPSIPTIQGNATESDA